MSDLNNDALKLLCRANWKMSRYECGAPEIDGKRPYGNSSVLSDIHEIIGSEPALEKDRETYFTDEQDDYAWKCHEATLEMLKKIFGNENIPALLAMIGSAEEAS